jgi:cytochrome P450
MAGTDTTSNNTTILVYMLAKHPEVEKKVREEMREVIGDTLDNLDFDVLKRLTYLEKVQKEALRMYSPSAGIFLR